MIEDVYLNAGVAFVRRWDLVNGRAECPLDAIEASAAGAVPALQKNAAVRQLIAEVEAYEAAKAIEDAGEPDNGQPKQIPDPDAVKPEDAADDWTAPLIDNPEWALAPRDGDNANPRWPAYDAAVAAVAAADPVTVNHAQWRAGATDVDHESVVRAQLAAYAARPLAVDPRPVPNTVTLFQGRTVMRQLPGPPPFPTLFDAVDAYVEAHKADNHALYDAWNYSNGFDRNGALVRSLAPAFGITDTQLDAMFRAGAAIRA